jgi:hypothetical protein
LTYFLWTASKTPRSIKYQAHLNIKPNDTRRQLLQQQLLLLLQTHHGALNRMKYTQIAAALAATAMTTSVFASNWVEVTTDMTAYVSTGLTANVTQELVFPDIVKPVSTAPENGTAAVSSSETVTVTPDGNVTYTGDSAPGGGTDSKTAKSINKTGNTDLGRREAKAGELSITGEPGYTIGVTISSTVSDGNVPTGMGFIAVFDNDGAASSSTETQLGPDGNLVLPFGGQLKVDHNFVLTPGEVTEIELTALINYRA